MNTSKSIRECTVEKELVARVQAEGGQAYNFASPGRRGVPDRLVLLPGRAPEFVELKRPCGRRLGGWRNHSERARSADHPESGC